MLVHKGGQINNVQLITGLGLGLQRCHNYKIAVSCVQRMEVIVKMKKEREKVRGRGGMCTKNGSYCEKENVRGGGGGSGQWGWGGGGSGWIGTEN